MARLVIGKCNQSWVDYEKFRPISPQYIMDPKVATFHEEFIKHEKYSVRKRDYQPRLLTSFRLLEKVLLSSQQKKFSRALGNTFGAVHGKTVTLLAYLVAARSDMRVHSR
jgi:hypothetical protein